MPKSLLVEIGHTPTITAATTKQKIYTLFNLNFKSPIDRPFWTFESTTIPKIGIAVSKVQKSDTNLDLVLDHVCYIDPNASRKHFHSLDKFRSHLIMNKIDLLIVGNTARDFPTMEEHRLPVRVIGLDQLHENGKWTCELSASSIYKWIQNYTDLIAEYDLGPMQTTIAKQARASFLRMQHNQHERFCWHNHKTLQLFERFAMKEYPPTRLHPDLNQHYPVTYIADFDNFYPEILATEMMPRRIKAFQQNLTLKDLAEINNRGDLFIGKSANGFCTNVDFATKEIPNRIDNVAIYQPTSIIKPWAHKMIKVRNANPNMAACKMLGVTFWGKMAQRSTQYLIAKPPNWVKARAEQIYENHDTTTDLQIPVGNNEWLCRHNGKNIVYSVLNVNAYVPNVSVALAVFTLAHAQQRVNRLTTKGEIIEIHTDSMRSTKPIEGGDEYKITQKREEKITYLMGSRFKDEILDSHSGTAKPNRTYFIPGSKYGTVIEKRTPHIGRLLSQWLQKQSYTH